MIRTTLFAALAMTNAATAQYEITIDVEDPVLMPGQSTSVMLVAGFDTVDYAMAVIETDFVTSVGGGGLSNAMVLAPLDGPGTTVGTASATGWNSILAGQIHEALIHHADPLNPVAFWQATYTAPADVSAPFDIDLRTRTARYDVYSDFWAFLETESRLADLTEGTATIHVIPAPASGLVLALGVLAVRRRR